MLFAQLDNSQVNIPHRTQGLRMSLLKLIHIFIRMNRRIDSIARQRPVPNITRSRCLWEINYNLNL